MHILKNTTFWHYALVVTLILVGVFLRVYNFSDYMHFELDQARDAYVIWDSIAANHWPEKGPIARGSDLHLGPAFYWFGIVSAQLFGFSAQSIAYVDLLFGVLALALTYLLVRRIFDPFVALGVLALTSTSLFLITYSRFAWNPNGLYFWSLLLTLSLLWMTSVEDRKKLYASAALVAFSSAVLMQLHFFAFFVVPIVVIGYLVINRQLVSGKVFVIIIGSFLLFVSPMLVTEVRSSWQSATALIATVTDKGSQDATHSLVEKIFRGSQKTAHFFALSHIGYQGGGGSIGMDLKSSQIFSCSDSCKERLPYSLFSILLFGFATHALFRHMRKVKSDISSLALLWVIGCALFLTVLAYQISPRFYLFVMPIYVLLWGALIHFVRERFGWRVASVILFLICFSNLSFAYSDFMVSQSSQEESIDAPRDSILGRSDRVTLGALRRGANIVHVSTAEKNQPFVVIGDNRYARALYYLLDIERDNPLVLCYTKRSDVSVGYDTLPVWLLVRAGSSDHIPEQLATTHRVEGRHDIGTISFYELSPRVQVGLSSKTVTPEDCYMR